MNSTMNAVRLGVIRGWIEFQIYYLKDLQSLIGTVIIALLLVGVLWFEVVVRGKPAHAGDASVGRNAIEASFAVISGGACAEGADWAP